MLVNVQPITVKQIKSANHDPQIILKLLEQDEPHIRGKLLNSDVIEFFHFCLSLELNPCKLGHHLHLLDNYA